MKNSKLALIILLVGVFGFLFYLVGIVLLYIIFGGIFGGTLIAYFLVCGISLYIEADDTFDKYNILRIIGKWLDSLPQIFKNKIDETRIKRSLCTNSCTSPNT